MNGGVHVLGSIRYRNGEGNIARLRGPGQRKLLSALAVSGTRTVRSEALAEMVGTTPSGLHTAVSRLRAIVGPDVIGTDDAGYRLVVPTDAEQFEELAARPGTALQRLDWIQAALGLWDGDAFEEFSHEPWAAPTATRLDELRLVAMEDYAELLMALQRNGEAVASLESMCASNPMRDRPRGLLIKALAGEGRQADALASYQKYRSFLIEETGTEPSAYVQEIERLVASVTAGETNGARTEYETGLYETKGILVTDIEDSTLTWEHQPEQMAQALARHDQILSDSVAASNGTIIKHTGDGLLAVFADVAAAAEAAIETQRHLQSVAWPPGAALRVRAAIDEGPMQARDGDVFGPVANRVSRIMSAGHGGQILLSAEAAARARQPTRTLGEADLKGVGRLEVHQIVSDGLDQEHPPLRTQRSLAASTRPAFDRIIRGYELREELSGSDYSVVYRAYQRSVGREVAIKVIRPQFANTAEFVKRFEAEAQFVAQLEHPHIISLYDYWRDPEGAYLVMNYLGGGNLARSLERSTLNPPAAVRLLDDVGRALSYAHRHGVVHGDIKPSNILLDDDGNAYLSDFGVAHHGRATQGPEAATSVAYTAPEVLVGGFADARSDMYCLGLLTHEILTGERPPLGGQPRPINEVRSDLDPGVARAIARAADPDPRLRYQRVDDFIAELRLSLGGEAASAQPAVRERGDARNPFKGLQAFAEVDSGDFYGRESLTRELLDMLVTNNLVAAVGPSGSGKSSVAKAGVLPAVRSGESGLEGTWVIAEMFPGSHPFEELEAALIRVAVERPASLLAALEHDERGLLRISKQILAEDTSLLLVIDQFEEVFSLVAHEEVRVRFLDSLVAACADKRSRVKVLVTLRADFFDRPLVHPEFGTMLKDGLVPVTMPSDENLALAITQPAEQAGLELEPGLTASIVSDVSGQPGGLPLLQYALTELVEAHKGQVLTLAAYRGAGGALGALGRRAEEIYTSLTPSGQDAARELLLRLVNVNEQGDDTRRRVRRSELASLSIEDSAMADAIDRFGEHRLLSFDLDPVTRGQTVEVAHEAVLREWPRYRDWIDDRRKDLLLGRRLTSLATDWEDGNRNDSFLVQGTRLDQFEAWRQTAQLATTESEAAFLDASLAKSAANEAAEKRSIRRTKRLAIVSTALAVLSAIALVATLLALRSARTAEQQARAAESAAHVTTARALVTTDPALALAMAAEADSRGSNLNTRSALMTTRAGFNTRRGLGLHSLEAHTGGIEQLDFSPDGSLVATASWDRTAKIWDTATGLEVATLGAHTSRVFDVAFSNSGSFVATAGEDQTAIIWDAETFEAIRTIEGHTNQVRSVSFSPDDDRMLTASTDGEIKIWETTTGNLVLTLDQHENGVLAAKFSPDGTTIASGSRDRTARLWSTTTGALVTTLGPFTGPVREVAYNADSTLLATANANGTVGVWDIATGEEVSNFPAHAGAVWDVAFSDDGLIATASVDGTAKVLDPVNGAELLAVTEHTSAVVGVAFRSDGSMVATASLDGTAKLADPNPPAQLQYLNGHTGWVLGSIFDSSGEIIATVSRDETARLWNARTGEQLYELTGHEGWVTSHAFSPNGELLATGGNDSSIRFWDTRTGQQVAKVQEVDGGYSGLRFSSDGTRLFAGSSTGLASVFDVSSATELARFDDHDGGIRGIALSPDDQLLVTASADETAKIWNTETQEVMFTLTGHAGVVRRAAFDPTGSTLVTIGADGTMRIWEVATGELLESIQANSGFLFEVVFSDDGTTLATAAQDGSVTLWDAATWSELVSIQSHGGGVRGLDISPDGSWLLSAGEDRLGLLQPIATSATTACDLASRYVTEQELAAALRDTEIQACTNLVEQPNAE